jgi:hypothetical protein
LFRRKGQEEGRRTAEGLYREEGKGQCLCREEGRGGGQGLFCVEERVRGRVFVGKMKGEESFPQGEAKGKDLF